MRAPRRTKVRTHCAARGITREVGESEDPRGWWSSGLLETDGKPPNPFGWNRLLLVLLILLLPLLLLDVEPWSLLLLLLLLLLILPLLPLPGVMLQAPLLLLSSALLLGAVLQSMPLCMLLLGCAAS